MWDCPEPFGLTVLVLLAGVSAVFLTFRALAAAGRKRLLAIPLGCFSAFALLSSSYSARVFGVSLPGQTNADATLSVVFTILPFAFAVLAAVVWLRLRVRSTRTPARS